MVGDKSPTPLRHFPVPTRSKNVIKLRVLEIRFFQKACRPDGGGNY
jgi:hypothetical protein